MAAASWGRLKNVNNAPSWHFTHLLSQMQLLGILFSVSLLFLQSNLDKIPTEDQKKFWSIWQVHQWLFFESEKCRTWILTLSTPAALNAFCKIFQFCMNSCSWLEANLTLLILTQSFKKKGKSHVYPNGEAQEFNWLVIVDNHVCQRFFCFVLTLTN